MSVLKKFFSSLHWSISLSYCSFSYSGLCYEQLKLSIDDVIVAQKDTMGHCVREKKLFYALENAFKYVLFLFELALKNDHMNILHIGTN